MAFDEKSYYFYGTRNARRRRRRAEFSAAARGASSSERNKAFVLVEVPPLPARRSAMPPCRSPITVEWRFLHFCVCAHGFFRGDDVWRIDGLFTRKVYSNGCKPRWKRASRTQPQALRGARTLAIPPPSAVVGARKRAPGAKIDGDSRGGRIYGSTPPLHPAGAGDGPAEDNNNVVSTDSVRLLHGEGLSSSDDTGVSGGAGGRGGRDSGTAALDVEGDGGGGGGGGGSGSGDHGNFWGHPRGRATSTPLPKLSCAAPSTATSFA